ncbi:hypothetical protein TNCV_1369461 [Trichonephila clavipes]|nr:hypothetical protein TNCV_1369461 [Trichonephila clavipes]
MPKIQTYITCMTVHMVTAELCYECITRSCYITNFVKHVRSTSPDMMLVDEELYVVQSLEESILNVCG